MNHNAKPLMMIVSLMIAVSGCSDPNEGLQAPAEEVKASVLPAVESGPSDSNETSRPIKVRAGEDGNRRGSVLCNIEYIDKERFSGDVSRSASNTVITGWVGDEISKGLPSAPSIRFVLTIEKHQQQWRLPLMLGIKRQDVANYTKEEGLSESGFQRDVSLEALPKGRYHVYLAYTSGDSFYTCDNGRYLVIE